MTDLAVEPTYHARAAALLDHEWRMLAGGRLLAARSGRTYTDSNPATGEPLAEVPFAEAEDVDAVVAAAQAAAPGWAATPLVERSAMLAEAIRVLLAHREELGILDALDSGNPASAMIAEVDLACEWLEWCRGVAGEVKGATLPAPRDRWLLTRREPYGVVLRITAYNHPVLFAAQKLGAPLMTGNVVILKIPQQTPLAPLRMGELLRHVFPPGVVSVVTGSGSLAGDRLVRHPAIKRISLIGGIGTGQTIQKAAAESGIKHVTLELGGKNPMIVLPDVDVESAAHAAVRGMNFRKTQGQSCGSCSRLFVHEAIHDQVVARVAELCGQIRVGDPLDPSTEMGCMVSDREFQRVLGMIAAARAEGARLVCGGGRPPGLDTGAFIAPTVFDGVTMDMAIGREEVFGPVLSVLRWSDEEQLLADVAAVPLGLTSSVWTRDLGAAMRFADRLDSGYVWINDCAAHYLGAPFGGRGLSGTESEEGMEELLSYTQTKTIAIAPA